MCRIHLARCERCTSLAAVWQEPYSATDDRFQTCGQVLRVDEPQRYCQACSESAASRTKREPVKAPVFLLRLRNRGQDLVKRSLDKLKLWFEMRRAKMNERFGLVSERPKIRFIASTARSRPASKIATERISVALEEMSQQEQVRTVQEEAIPPPPGIQGPGVRLPGPGQGGHQAPNSQRLSASSSIYSQELNFLLAQTYVRTPPMPQQYPKRGVPIKDITHRAEEPQPRDSSTEQALPMSDGRITWIH